MLENALTAVAVSVGVFLLLRVVLTMRERISGTRARAMVEEGAQLVDVRTPAEHATAAIPGSKNIPVAALSARVGELEKDRPVVVYCASGMRSARAAAFLKARGFEAHDLGPMGRW